MAWKITGRPTDDQGRDRELYVVGTASEAVARNIATREQMLSGTVERVPDSHVPSDAWLVAAPRPRPARFTGARQSLEGLANSELARRPVRTLALGVALGVFGGMVLFTLLTWLVGLIFAGVLNLFD